MNFNFKMKLKRPRVPQELLFGLATPLLPLLAIDMHPVDSFAAAASQSFFRSGPISGDLALQDFFAIGRHRSRRRCRPCPLDSTTSRQLAIPGLTVTARAESGTTLSGIST